MERSGLRRALKDRSPIYIPLFENVGGRWTFLVHLLMFAALFNLNAQRIWDRWYARVQEVRAGTHLGCQLGHQILDRGVTRIALVVPDELFWFGKAIEQNWNESIWQPGFATLIGIQESHWRAQQQHYDGQPNRMIINLSAAPIAGANVLTPQIPGLAVLQAQQLAENGKVHDQQQEVAEALVELFITFYAMTHTAASRLIGRALRAQGIDPATVNLSDLDSAGAKLVRRWCFLMQHVVELGKTSLETWLQDLQATNRRLQLEASAGGPIDRTKNPAIDAAVEESIQLAEQGQFKTNVPELQGPDRLANVDELAAMVIRAAEHARRQDRIFVPMPYLDGEHYRALRIRLTELGYEWVMQGTSDQHISVNQVEENPDRFVMCFISMVPPRGAWLPGLPAIGFTPAYADNVPPHLILDRFAEALYNVTTDPADRGAKGGQALFLRWMDTDAGRAALQEGFERAAASPRRPPPAGPGPRM
jgi:hypothetical protein